MHIPPVQLAFGTMQFGGTADQTQSRALYDACRDAGITHFDTAHGYTAGASETFLGQFAARERDRLYIATKIGYLPGTDRVRLMSDFDLSRKRLGMDRVDLLYLHRLDPEIPLEDSLETIATLQQAGTIRHIGVSNFAAWQVMKAQAILARLGTRIDAIQPMLNLVKRQAEVEILPMARDQNLAVYPYSPLGGGLLTGKYLGGGQGRLSDDARYAKRYSPDWMTRTAADLLALAQDVGTDPATLAVAWAARVPGVTAPLISARSVEQLRPSLAAKDFEMTDALFERLSALSPTPPPATDRLEEA